jgi:uncharacterized membrane protein YphA (DoxX/SURF4 family)
MKVIYSYLLWFLSVFLVVCAIVEMSYGFMDPESPFAKLSIQNINWEYFEYDWVVCLIEVSIASIALLVSGKMNPRQTKIFAEIIFRIGLGSMFILASQHKISQPVEFATLIAQYQLLPSFAVNLFALTLAPLELIIGALTILGPNNKWNARLLLILMGTFIIAIAQALVRDLGITCGCFAIEGANDKKGAYVTLVRDLVLLGPILWLMFQGREKAWIWSYFRRSD